MGSLDFNKLPKHVAIIMDGNGRWASERRLDRSYGHIEGVRRADEIAYEANKLGIKVLTLYTFSTENWNRPEAEVNMLMTMLTATLNKQIDKLVKENIRFQMVGRKDRLPQSVLQAIDKVAATTSKNTGLVLNLAFNYGSRIEIVDAVKNIAEEVAQGKLKPEDISEESLSNRLYTAGLPDPDLLIRTSGEKRISNFLLWQLSYAEFYFTETFWPDFNTAEFHKALLEFQNRERRFGNLAAQEEQS